MAWKNREKQLASQRAHYLRNRDQRIELSRKRQVEIRAYVKSYKTGRACFDCGISYPPYVMDFDHRDPSKKTRDLSRVFRYGWCDKRIQEEIDKCDLVCANCHRERTHGNKYPSVTRKRHE